MKISYYLFVSISFSFVYRIFCITIKNEFMEVILVSLALKMTMIAYHILE